MFGKKVIFWILLQVVLRNGRYVGSIVDDLVLICDEVVKETKIFATKNSLPTTVPKKWTFTSLFINHHSIIDSC